jgi:hypothetical protein
MDKKIILWIVLGALVLIVLFQTLQLSAIGNAIASAGSGQAVSAPSGGGMVGGC